MEMSCRCRRVCSR